MSNYNKLYTPADSAIVFIDQQPQMLFGTSYPDRQSIIKNTVAFAKATRVFDVPVVLTTVETQSFREISGRRFRRSSPSRRRSSGRR